MENKTKKVLEYLKEKGNITSWEAIEKFGATRLSAIIYNLRYKYNLDIRTEEINFIDRFGSKSRCAKYILEREK